MARLTATRAFDFTTFNLSYHFNVSTSMIQEGPFRMGLASYDERIEATDYVGALRSQLLAYADDLTYTSAANVPSVTGGMIGNIQYNLALGSSGTLWVSNFRISDIAVSAVDTVAMLASDDSADDRTFLAGLFSGDDLIGLSQFGDKMNGFGGNDKMDGYSGNDTLLGSAGNDTVNGGVGNDVLDGGFNNDGIYGGRGNDDMIGNNGNDTMRGGSGADTLLGGDGDDVMAGQVGADVLTGGDGVDYFEFGAGSGNDTITDYNDGIDFFRINTDSNAAIAWTETNDGNNVVITFASIPGISFTVLNTTAAQIGLEDFRWM